MTSKLIDDPKKIDELYEKNKQLNKESIQLLEGWIFTRLRLKNISETFIIACFHSCYYDIENTKKCLEHFFLYKIKYPEILLYRNPTDDKFQQSLSKSLQLILPKRTKENYDILYVRLLDGNPNNYNFEKQICLANMICSLQIYQRGISDGLIFIQDCGNCSFGHLFKINPFVAKAMISFVQEALPVRLKAIHAINMNFIAQKLCDTVKPFVNQGTRKLLEFHTSMETVYESVPKELLPVEIGGSVGTIKELQEDLIENLKRNVDFFKEDEDNIRELRSRFQQK